MDASFAAVVREMRNAVCLYDGADHTAAHSLTKDTRACLKIYADRAETAHKAELEALAGDIRWNCEHCTARLMYEHKTLPYSDHYPCAGCRLFKYGYGAKAKERNEPCL